jgi:Fe-S cluster assembly protein SufD
LNGFFHKSMPENDYLTTLNSASFTDGVFIYIPPHVELEKPIQIINLLIGNQDLLSQPRNLFITDKNAKAKIIVCDHTLSAQKFLTNSVTEIYCEQDSILDFYNLQNEHNGATHFSNTTVKQKKNSRFLSNVITLHGGIIRNNLFVDMIERNCETNALGLFLADKWQQVDNFTSIRHLEPDCVSNQLYKGILDDASIAAFSGKIFVARDAQNTKAYQSNNNILLTSDAKIHTKPQLEIYADNVKCSHGATVGQLDETALFYLRSRGISEKEARLLLLYGFANSIIKEISVDALKERINNLIDKRLRGELSRCNSCVINCC